MAARRTGRSSDRQRAAYPASMHATSPAGRAPRIVVTVAVAAAQSEPDLAERKNQRSAEPVPRYGGDPPLLDGSSTGAEREAAFATMDGLLLSGGADMDPVHYGQPG